MTQNWWIVVSYLLVGSTWLTTPTTCFTTTPLTKPLFVRDHHTPSIPSTQNEKQHDTSTSSTCLYGIPKMFRWLTDQYPDIINRQLEVGLSADLKVDNFYLDMNGIIHPCTHGNAEGEIILLDETAMFKKIFLYVDKLYKMVKPTQLLYLAVDGVAPRAKMNQQRSRRFRSAKEAEATAQEVLARQSYGKTNVDDKNAELLRKRFDSNCITPGTDFMLKLNLALAKWVEFKIETDPFWKNGADVVISGPDIPGEGEHKVMDYIRDCRELYYNEEQQNGDADGETRIHYRPGNTHVLYGLDADLIMLGLVTHEPNFHLLREKMSVVMAGRGRNKHRKKKDMMEYTKNDFEVLELTSLRQMLAIQFRRFADNGMLKVEFDLRRIIDDFVFMCILVGNDFLPHCPHLEIDGGAISLMISSYTELLEEWGGYLTHKEKIHPQRLEQFLYHLAVYEEEHFKRRGYEENEPGWNLSAEHECDDENDFYGTYFSGKPTPAVAVPANVKGSYPPAPSDNDELAANLDQTGANRKFRRRHPGNLSRSYRDFYYQTKLGWPVSDRKRTLFHRRAHVRDYLEGLHWNLNYYHNGCKSWDWYFPHLYSPLATDMVNLEEFYQDNEEEAIIETNNVEESNDDEDGEEFDEEGFKSFPFDVGTPFPSLAQLLAVLPPQSAPLLPKPLAELMINPASPLMEYYPPDFTTDPNGKRQSWEAVVQIPFIDADILLDTVQRILDMDAKIQQEANAYGEEDDDGTIKKKKPLLTKAERFRNKRGKSYTFVPQKDDNPEVARERGLQQEATSKRGTLSRKPRKKKQATSPQ